MLTKSYDHFPIAETNAWIFDLDNTIYPAESNLFEQVSQRMTDFISNYFDISQVEARALRSDLFARFGTTAKGLMEVYDMKPLKFLSYVHDIDLSGIGYDQQLDQDLAKLPGRKVIFTNGTRQHAMRILDAYGIVRHFDHCYDIMAADFQPKPDPATYQDMLEKTNINPNEAVMIEDMAVNLKPAADTGMKTVWLNHKLDKHDKTIDDEHVHYIARDLKSFLSTITA